MIIKDMQTALKISEHLDYFFNCYDVNLASNIFDGAGFVVKDKEQVKYFLKTQTGNIFNTYPDNIKIILGAWLLLCYNQGYSKPYIDFIKKVAFYAKKYDPRKWLDNPYLKCISLPSSGYTKGDISLFRDTEEDGNINYYHEPKFENGILIPRLYLGTPDNQYIIIRDSKSTWMSISPLEIYSHEVPISKAHGKVLTLGCGLGYYAFMIANKADVESITIVENNSDIIDLFSTYLLPQFPNKDKIKVIYADALEYMSKLEDGSFDFCFADIWRSSVDCVCYAKLKRICSKFHDTQICYWIEDSILDTLYMVSRQLFYKALMRFNKISDDALLVMQLKSNNELQQVLDYISKETKDIVLSSKSDISYYLSRKFISDVLSGTVRNKKVN